ncbi:MAG: bifunctional diguanylate cyclase/phosphodiesterase, partial [Sulfuriferula sp.]
HQYMAELITGNNAQIIAMLLLDLDRFKEINDTLGHHAGDKLLQQIGPRLAMTLADQSYEIFRLGGDEFVIVLNNLADTLLPLNLAQQLRTALQQPFRVEVMQVEIDASVGIALYPRDGADSHVLLRLADVAMYEAKHKAKGVVEYNREVDQHSMARLALMSELGSAIRSGQMVLHYQPKLDIQTSKIVGVEALVRWQHPQHGLLFPDAFIPFAEMSDAIHQLTEEVLRLAFLQQVAWQQRGITLNIAINLSARNLIDERCLCWLQTLLHETGVAAETVELEITETMLMIDPDSVIRRLHQITDLGVSISIDDFGSGYASLGYLQRLSPNILKIDKQFVINMLHEPHNQIIVRSTIALAHSLGMRVVAEGVENAESLALLEAMQCDFIQGYHLARPMQADQIANWLVNQRFLFNT